METLEIFQFGEFQVNAGSRSVKRGDRTVELSRRSFDVLLYLVRNPGRVISRDELLQNVWPDAFVDENSLTQSISVLRRALGERQGEKTYILTVPGRGYQFICSVEAVVPESRPGTAKATSGNEGPDGFLYQETVRTSIVTQKESVVLRRRLGAPVALVAGVLATAGLIGVLAWNHWRRVPISPMVIIADLENATGEPGLDRVLDNAVAADLKQSPYLNFLSRVRIQETMTQMQQKADTPLTPALAREICQRNNAQVMLRGMIAKLGQKYLLTLDATDCVSGDSLATSKADAESADGISHAIDTVSATIRKKLGESRSSIRSFNTPLVHENTGSFEALRSYSNARALAEQGKYADAIPLFERAIELDPKFAVAYADLASTYGNSGNRTQQVATLTKAYELRDFADERNRLFITALYHENITGNLEEALRNYRNWMQIYPGNLSSPGNMANIYTQLGQYEPAIPLAREALKLNPGDAVAYVILGRALLRAGQLDAARSICDQAVAKHLDGADMHSLMMQADEARNDAEGVKTEIEWARNHNAATRARLNEGLLAFAEGRIRVGQERFKDLEAFYKEQGATRQYAIYLLASSRILAETGHLNEARTLLASQEPPEGTVDPVVAMALLGDASHAEKLLNQELTLHPEDTLWNNFKAPQIRAALLLSQHKPQEAVEALRPSVPYELRTLEVPYMRGMAYLEANFPSAAEAEFRKVIDHRGVDPLSHLYPLARLGLARALARENKPKTSRDAYLEFFSLWKDADPREPLLQQAHNEFKSLKP